jgi:hypothetical protein
MELRQKVIVITGAAGASGGDGPRFAAEHAEGLVLSDRAGTGRPVPANDPGKLPIDRFTPDR